MRYRDPCGAWAVIVLALLSCACQASQATPSLQHSSGARIATVSTGTPLEQSRPPPQDTFLELRERMVQLDLEGQGIKDPAVLRAMRTVPRHEFVLPEYVRRAYDDRAFPIGYGQTISQPYIVARMTELLRIQPGDRVLEIGTGSGYQAAVLAELTDQVYTVEIIPELHERAGGVFQRLGYDSIHMLNADGYYGWKELAPYDAIIVTAAPDHIPQPLVNQLKDGARLVIPVGPSGGFQTLWLIEKQAERVNSTAVMGVIFVPLTGTGHTP